MPNGQRWNNQKIHRRPMPYSPHCLLFVESNRWKFWMSIHPYTQVRSNTKVCCPSTNPAGNWNAPTPGPSILSHSSQTALVCVIRTPPCGTVSVPAAMFCGFVLLQAECYYSLIRIEYRRAPRMRMDSRVRTTKFYVTTPLRPKAQLT